MGRVREPAVAGRFYPGAPDELEATVVGYLAAAQAPPDAPPPKAVIAPHAGYVYSGAVAASAYARLADRRDAITRVVLLGPAHHVFVAGLASPTSEAFATPLGDVPLDRDALERALTLPQVVSTTASPCRARTKQRPRCPSFSWQ